MSAPEDGTDALLTLHDTFGSVGWPSDWYEKELEHGWAFISPDLPGQVFVVTRAGRASQAEAGESAGEAIERLRSE